MPLVTLYPIVDHPLLGGKYKNLPPEEQSAQQILAEMLLGLVPPAYDDDRAEQLAYAVVLQINFQIERSLTPEVMKSVSNTHPGNTTSYRDRYLSPTAWAVVERVTGAATVGFKAPGWGA